MDLLDHHHTDPAHSYHHPNPYPAMKKTVIDLRRLVVKRLKESRIREICEDMKITLEMESPEDSAYVNNFIIYTYDDPQLNDFLIRLGIEIGIEYSIDTLWDLRSAMI